MGVGKHLTISQRRPHGYQDLSGFGHLERPKLPRFGWIRTFMERPSSGALSDIEGSRLSGLEIGRVPTEKRYVVGERTDGILLPNRRLH